MMYRLMQRWMQRLISTLITEINLCIYQLQISISELEWMLQILSYFNIAPLFFGWRACLPTKLISLLGSKTNKR